MALSKLTFITSGIDLADGTASDVGITGIGTVVWRFQ